jgi:hypothetical protein
LAYKVAGNMPKSQKKTGSYWHRKIGKQNNVMIEEEIDEL